MANTFTQLHVHFVFAVDGRQSLIQAHFRQELEKFIAGIIEKRNHKMLAIYCMPDHVHILIGKRPNQSESDLMRDIKTNSSAFVNGQAWIKHRFSWQEGYGAFAYSKSQVDRVIAYILNQPEHHKKQSFKEEFLEMLANFGIEYDEQYLFKWIADV